jgi:hypothetical protein
MPLEKRTDEEQAQGIWTPITIDGDEEWYLVRPLRPKDLEHLRKMATKKRWQNGQQVEEVDQERYNALLADFLVIDWQYAIFERDAQGNKVWLPCGLEEKIYLLATSLERSNILITQARLYADNDEARRAAEQDAFRRLHPAPSGHAVAGLRGVSEPGGDRADAGVPLPALS